MTESGPLQDQRQVWNDWNTASLRDVNLSRVSADQADVVEHWLNAPDLADQASLASPLDILEVGCGTGWMCERLVKYGQVTGVDLADEVVDRARQRIPEVTFKSGDFLEVELESGPFDVVVTLEAMAHFVDQVAFLDRIVELLRPGGQLMLATQNRPVMERNIRSLPSNGWYRRWVDHNELRELLEPNFTVTELTSVTPQFFHGPLHLINSEKLEKSATKVGLGSVMKKVKKFEERHFLGWSLVCLATKKV